MKVFVVHDAKGTIKSYAIPAPELEGQLGIEPARGESVTEVEVSELDQIEDVHERLGHLDEASETGGLRAPISSRTRLAASAAAADRLPPSPPRKAQSR